MKVVITAGGTGGHLIPAQNLADEFLKDNHEVIFLAKGLSENRNFSKEKYRFKEIESSPFKNLFSLFFILKGIFQTILFFFKYKPNLIIGFGSYYTFPILLASILTRKDIFLFEINVKMGKVNRLIKRFSKVLATQFFLKKIKKTELISMWPWKKNKNISKDLIRKKIGLKENFFTILVFGGSQGSNFINNIFIEAIKDIKIDFQVIHITGEKTEIKRYYEDKNFPYIVKEYEKDMTDFFLSSDMVLSRAGGCSISECIFYKIPSILIPFPKSSENHQVENALFMQDIVKGAKVFFQKDINKKSLAEEIKKVFMEKEKMQRCLYKFYEKNNKNRKTFYQLIKEKVFS